MIDEAKRIRLGNVAREFNISVQTIAEYLATKGHNVYQNPNVKLTPEQYGLVADRFSDEREMRKRADEVLLPSDNDTEPICSEIESETRKTDEVVVIKNVFAGYGMREREDKVWSSDNETVSIDAEKRSKTKRTHIRSFNNSFAGGNTNYFNRGIELFNDAKYKVAVEYFQAAIEENVNVEKSYLFLAKTYYNIGNTHLAKKTIFRLLSINPENVEALLFLNNISKQKEVNRESVTNSSIKSDPIVTDEELPDSNRRKLTLKSGNSIYYEKHGDANCEITITAPPPKFELAEGHDPSVPYIDELWEGYEEPQGDIVIPSKLQNFSGQQISIKIGYGAFNMLRKIRDVYLPDEVSEIEYGAFYESSIRHINLSDSLKHIGEWAFASSGLSGIVKIPSSIKEVADHAFEDCKNINEIILHDKICAIGSKAFSGTSITEIQIPGSVRELESGSFYGCRNLKKVIIEDGVEKIRDEVFLGCGMDEIRLPLSVKSIGSSSFSNCKSLKKVVLNEGLEYIDSDAFLNCPINELKVPSSVKTIRGGAFQTDTGIRIYFHGAPPTLENERCVWGLDDFNYEEISVFSDNAEIFVPRKYIKDYLNHPVWKDIHYNIY